MFSLYEQLKLELAQNQTREVRQRTLFTFSKVFNRINDSNHTFYTKSYQTTQLATKKNAHLI